MDREDASSGGRKKYSGDEVRNLLTKMSPEDQLALTKVLKDCTRDMALTRGLPVAMLVTGSLYLARHNIRRLFNMSPLRWPFYTVVAISAITTTNFFTLGECKKRLDPAIDSLMEKYSNAPSGGLTYDELRRRNREASGGMPHYPVEKQALPYQQQPGASVESVMYTPPMPSLKEGQTTWRESPYPREDSWKPVPSENSWSRIPSEAEEPPALMSGTPGVSPKKTTYGDEGFS